RLARRATLAEALHQAGRRAGAGGAEAHFREAEQRQAELQPSRPLLYSLQGFLYRDLLLAPAERGAWFQAFHPRPPSPGSEPRFPHPAIAAVRRRAEQTLAWAREPRLQLLTIALDRLTLGRAALYESLMSSGPEAGAARQTARGHVVAAVDGLR